MSNSSGTELPSSSNSTSENAVNAALQDAVNVALAVTLMLVTFSLGCTVKISELWEHLRKPWGILIGLVCQFGLMPLFGFLMSLAFSVQPQQAVAILIMGCCPGGAISNTVCYWIDGDMDLSLAMTTVSTVLALGMMPLCLRIYSQYWVEASFISIPYINIGVSGICVAVPIAFGVFVNQLWPNAGKIILKIGTVLGWLLVALLNTVTVILHPDAFNTEPYMVLILLLFPVIGVTAGLTLSFFARMPWNRCRSIAVETGIQNVQLCFAVLYISFRSEEADNMIIVPFLFGLNQIILSIILVIVYQVCKRISLQKLAVLNSPAQALEIWTTVNASQGQDNEGLEPDSIAD